MERGEFFLTVLDWGVFLLYLCLTAGIGFWAGRNQETTEDYFLGARQVPWWAAMLSLVATETSAVTVVAIPAMIYGPGGDFGFLHCAVGFAIGKVLIAFFILPAYFQREITTPYEFLKERLGPSGQMAGSLLFIAALFIGAAFRVYVGAIPLEVATGLDLSLCLFFIAALAIAYTLIGGLRAVIWTDVFQMALFIGGGVICLFFIFTSLPDGFQGFVSHLAQTGKHHPFDNPHYLDFGFRRTEWGSWSYDWTLPHTVFAGFIGAAFLTLSTHGTDHSNLQRLLACPSLRSAQCALLISGVFVFLQFVLFLSVGGAISAFYTAWEKSPDLAEVNHVLPYFIIHELPVVLSGLLVAGIFAAAMSTVDSALSALSATTLKDWRGSGTGDRHATRGLHGARWSVFVWGLLLWMGAQVAAAMGREDLINAIFQVSTTLYGPLLGVFLIALLPFFGGAASDGGKKEAENRFSIIWIPVGSGLSAQAIIFLWGQSWLLGELAFQLAWPWITMVGSLATVLPAGVIEANRRRAFRSRAFS